MMRSRCDSSSTPFAAWVRSGSTARSLRLHELKKNAPVNHDFVAGVETRGDLVMVPGSSAYGDVLSRETAVCLSQISKRQVLVVTQDCGDWDQQPRALLAGLNKDADIHLLLQDAAWIFCNHTHCHRTRVGIHQSRDVVHSSREFP